MTYGSSPGKYDENEAFPLMLFSKVRFGFRSMCVNVFFIFDYGKGSPRPLEIYTRSYKEILAKQVFLCFLSTYFFN